jgi:hypothetical protein
MMNYLTSYNYIHFLIRKYGNEKICPRPRIDQRTRESAKVLDPRRACMSYSLVMCRGLNTQPHIYVHKKGGERKGARKGSEGDGKANSVISAQMAIGRQEETPALSAEDDNNKRS